MQNFELGVLNWIQIHFRCIPLDHVMPVVSAVCNRGMIWIILAVVLLAFRRTRRVGLTVCLALVLDLLCCNVILKPLVARIRPCDVNTAVQLLISRPRDYSFPSGHAASSFAAVFALRASGSRLWIPALVLALLIAFSRLYLYVHWPSDILAGAVLGIALGYLAHGILTRFAVKKRVPE
jgi:undecaprenyl-diphosphatase